MSGPGSAVGRNIPAHRVGHLVRMGLDVEKTDYVVALAGNPNTGKSTVFNNLTGLRQHTGNWPGKTVTRAEGAFGFGDSAYMLVDLPGTYSLLATSSDEEVARDFLLFGQPDVTVIVVDACRLERNLNLVLQILEITDRVVICLNLMDEARRHRLDVDADRLSVELGVPVVPTAARYSAGMDALLQTIHRVATGETVGIPRRAWGQSAHLRHVVDELVRYVQRAFPGLPNARWVSLRLLDGDERIRRAVEVGELGELGQSKPADDRSSRHARLSSAGAGDTTADLLAAAASLRWKAGPDFHQDLVEAAYVEAARIADTVVERTAGAPKTDWDRKLDQFLTARWTALPVMVAMLAAVLWLTVAGANVPSAVLSSLLIDTIHPCALKRAAAVVGTPWWLDGLLLDGAYLATAWVVSVMLPPMAIFFPLFTLLEDFGYLPRIAFNLDTMFKRCGAHGKQALTMCMGFGCNAAGVIATRVIDSPRERLIAIITNNFALCNGRWPTQILIASIFIGALAPDGLALIVSTSSVVAVALLGVAISFVVSWGLSRTVLRGEPSAFHLELPPYRPPRLLQTLYTSLIDRTIFVLWRAILFAVPAGAVIWLIANIPFGDDTVAGFCIRHLDPVATLIGLNGVILLAYVVAIPANEIVVPTVLMLTVLSVNLTGAGEGAGVMFELESKKDVFEILQHGGWTRLTAVNLMLLSLLHNPCSTTIYTIWKETRSGKWTAVASLLPLAMGLVTCFLVAQIWRLVAGAA